MPTWMKIALSTLLLTPMLAGAKPQVLWLYTDWPPHQIVTGPLQGQGTFDKLLQLLQPELTEFEHQRQLVSLGRLEQHIQQQQYTVCTTGTLFTEARSQDRYFSIPMAVGPGIFINYLADSPIAQYKQENGSIDILTLAANKQWIGAYQPTRYYAPVVMQALAKEHNLMGHQFTSELNAAMLLQSRRVDYVLEYPERLQFYAMDIAEKLALRSAVVDGAEPVSISHVTCNKTLVGKKLINEINQLLPTLWQQSNYSDAMLYHLDDAVSHALMPAIKKIRQQTLPPTK